MKRILAFTAVALCAVGALDAQQSSTTPNIGLKIPFYGTQDWQIPLSYDLSQLDLFLSGNLPLPGLDITGNFSIPSGSTNPATCKIGELFFNTSEAPGSNLLTCTALNTWTSIAGGITVPVPVAQGGTGGTVPTDAQNNLDYLSTLTGSVARSYRSKFSDFVSLKDFGAVCDNSANDAAAIAAAGASSTQGVNIPFGQVCLTNSAFTPTKVYLGKGRVNNQGYLQAESLTNITTKPSRGNQWSIANGQLTDIVVSGGVATVHLSVSPTPQTVLIEVSGVISANALNTPVGVATPVTSNPTGSSFTFSTSAANGTYTDASIIIDDRTNVAFGGDTTRDISSEAYSIASSVSRGGLGDFYIDYTLIPHYVQQNVNSGFSGTNAITTSSLSIGNTVVPVNSTANFSVNQVVNIDTTNTDTRKITAINPGVSITVTPPLSNSHTSSVAVGSFARTFTSAYMVEQSVGATGGGDNYAYSAFDTCGTTPQAGQPVAFNVSTCGIFGGAVGAGANENYLQASEIQISDNGFDTFVVADARGLVRTNDTAAHNEEWIGAYIQSSGSKNIDAMAVYGGRSKIGIDMSRLLMDSDLRVIQMPQNGRIYYDITTTPVGTGIMGIFPIYGNTIHSLSYSYFDTTLARYHWFDEGVDALQFDQFNAIFNGNLSVGSKIATTPTSFSFLAGAGSGTMAYVIDATSQAYGATYTGGGSLTAHVSFDGTTWTVFSH